MKRFLKELVLLLFQIIAFYVLPIPLTAGPADPIGMVLLIFGVTLLLSLLMGGLSREPVKWLYPAVVALLFLPAITIYYNPSAAVHTLWYLALSAAGVALGFLIRRLIRSLT